MGWTQGHLVTHPVAEDRLEPGSPHSQYVILIAAPPRFDLVVKAPGLKLGDCER